MLLLHAIVILAGDAITKPEIKKEEDIPGDIVEGDIELTAEQMAIYKKTGMEGLVKSQAWRRGRKWPRNIGYEVTGSIGNNIQFS